MDQPGGALTTIAEERLKWEKSYTYNIGVEFGLFANRLFGTVEYFSRYSKDLLQNVKYITSNRLWIDTNERRSDQ